MRGLPGRLWARTFKSPAEVDWEEVARRLGTSGSGEKQRARHRSERAGYHRLLDEPRRRSA